MESWEGSKEKQSYTHIMTKNASVSYTWAFQRTNQAKDVRVHTPTHIHRCVTSAGARSSIKSSSTV